MTTMQVSRTTSASPESVWAVMTDLEGSPSVVTGIDAVEVLTPDQPFGVGTTWRETRTMFGKSATEEMHVTEIDPGRAYTVESASSGARYTSHLVVEPEGDGARISMSFSGAPDGAVARFFASTVGKLFESGTRKALEQDLADIAAAAEAN